MYSWRKALSRTRIIVVGMLGPRERWNRIMLNQTKSTKGTLRARWSRGRKERYSGDIKVLISRRAFCSRKRQRESAQSMRPTEKEKLAHTSKQQAMKEIEPRALLTWKNLAGWRAQTTI